MRHKKTAGLVVFLICNDSSDPGQAVADDEGQGNQEMEDVRKLSYIIH